MYCNDQLKKHVTPLLKLARGVLSVCLLMSISEAFSVPFYTLIKLCYTKVFDWSSLIPGPEAKSSSEIINLTSFTISYLSLSWGWGVVLLFIIMINGNYHLLELFCLKTFYYPPSHQILSVLHLSLDNHASVIIATTSQFFWASDSGDYLFYSQFYQC